MKVTTIAVKGTVQCKIFAYNFISNKNQFLLSQIPAL